ncbi:hypothetical protein KPSA1_03910 [Pseudomonas syringae pv. actinidiae]|uniref:Uncharacterized protein n=1 Tax=Pseudomonas syringae pv. actinidiae TaxID=103796 RepID=A0A2V0QMM6_PSESF|nr:hypothetical protein KPSA1_03910 [Pseudomonas syringae pv. actinidiae]
MKTTTSLPVIALASAGASISTRLPSKGRAPVALISAACSCLRCSATTS